jgi:UDP-N-acetylmuramate dehydrogenase
VNKILELKNKILQKFPVTIGRLAQNRPMSLYSTFKVGGPADLIFFPSSSAELMFAINAAKEAGITFTVIGNGSNILVSDKGIRGLIIILNREFAEIGLEGETESGQKSDTIIYADAGALLSTVSKFAASKGLTGMEFAAGIPGSIGGAIYMNAGAYDCCMADIVFKTEGYDPQEDRLFVLEDLQSHQFEYRKSLYENTDAIVLKIWIKLQKGDIHEIQGKMDDFSTRRRNSQPLELPSAGSTFKRPEGHFAGKLIEDAGLKGHRIGGACVSEKHAGFIVNDKGATARDVYDLMEYVKAKVFEKHGVRIDPEVRIFGEW